MFNSIMKKIVSWLDPKLDRFRDKRPTPKYSPKTFKEFIELLQRTPKSVLSDADRDRLAAVMSFESKKVQDLMRRREDMIFVYEKDFLGPLMLDKLYHSGSTHFPVVDHQNHVKGIIHTEALNALEIKKADRAEKYLSQDAHYLHTSDSLRFAAEEIIRLDATYFMVLDKHEELAGFLTLEILLDYLIG